MTGKVFADSNIWVYLFTAGDEMKCKTADEFITENVEEDRLVVSYQVINEVCCVLKKLKYTETEIMHFACGMISLCEVCGYSDKIIYIASELREKYPLSFWDSHIVASALESQCRTLASEDMADGLIINGMSIVNVLK